ncbi:hypothetical protein LY76DRAFT_589270 [Colletotrichum caudatum]|nr:hypothetical protein LY76DRAFT_589270 [Colletotrichum caudatum]
MTSSLVIVLSIGHNNTNVVCFSDCVTIIVYLCDLQKDRTAWISSTLIVISSREPELLGTLRRELGNGKCQTPNTKLRICGVQDSCTAFGRMQPRSRHGMHGSIDEVWAKPELAELMMRGTRVLAMDATTLTEPDEFLAKKRPTLLQSSVGCRGGWPVHSLHERNRDGNR